MSIPEGATTEVQDVERSKILVKGSETANSIDLYYRTADMMIPTLQIAEDPNSDDVGVVVSMVPTFDPVPGQDFYEEVEDEVPE